jgi:polysaccharide export outer membrane protein
MRDAVWKAAGCICLAVVIASAAVGCKRNTWIARCREFTPVPPPQNQLDTLPASPVPASPPYAPLDVYLLRVGDEIAFTLSVDPQATSGAYRMRVNDQLSIEYLHEQSPEHRLRTVRVLPNGTIDLPMIGSVEVEGQTVQEVTQQVNERAKKFYRFPQIALAVTETAQRAEELRRAFTSGFNNQSLTVVVSPDGTINLPEAGTIHVMYRTLPDVREQVQELYAQLVPGVKVWPHLTRRAADQIYVLGQVQNPGQFLLDRPTHVSQAIARAGGWLLSAHLDEVVLIRYHEGCPQAVMLNLRAAIYQDYPPRSVDLTDDLLLADGDVVIVPRDKVQNANDFIRRVFTEGIYGVIPIPSLHGNGD